MHRLGVFPLAAVVVASMIGAGVFTTSGFALADLGTPGRVMFVWVLGGGIAVLGALSYGLIAREVLESGGEYVYLARNVHPIAGFVAGWVSLLAGFSGAIAFAATAFEAYLFPGGGPAPVPEKSVAIALVVVAGVLHGVVPRLGVVMQNAVVAVKLAALGVFIAVAAWLHLEHPLPASAAASALPPLSITATAGSLVWVFLSYSGFNAAVYLAEEAREPAKNVPRAMLLGTLVVFLAYLALNALFVCAAPASAVAGSPNVAFVVARFLGGSLFAESIRAVVLLALLTSVLSMVMTGPRVYAKMADDGLLPPVFEAANGLRRAVMLQAFLAVVIISVSGLRELLSYLGFTLSLSSALAIASVFIAYRRSSRRHRPLWHWLVPFLYVVAVVGLALVAATRSHAEFVAAIATIGSGCLLFFAVRRFGRRAAAR